MNELVQNDQLLGQLHDAGTLLVDSCHVLLQTPPETEKEQAAVHGARLAGAIVRLRELLEQVPMLLFDPPGPSSQLAADSRPHGGSTTLLHLPDDLLHRIAHLVGKQTRAICSRLCNAYGPPRLTLKQPHAGFGMQLATNSTFEGYQTPLTRLQPSALAHALAAHGSKLSLAGVRSCSARWPGWAAQVTRLELSDTCSLDVPALRAIHESLPGLQQLTLAEEPRAGFLQGRLPRLEHVTRLGMLCSTHNLAPDVLGYGWIVRFELMEVAPNVRSLHLDLRFNRLGTGRLAQALQPLAQLSHLELVCKAPAHQDAGMYHREVRGSLGSLAGRLQSLVFLTPTTELEPGLLAVLQRLTRLTSLGWCTNWGEPDDGVQCAECLLLPGLRQLVVGPGTSVEVDARWCPEDAGRLAALLAAGGAEAVPTLQRLALPLVTVFDEEDIEPGTELVATLLVGVAQRCPAVTSLRVGLVWHHDVEPQPGQGGPAPEQAWWLTQVARLQQLQRLVVTMNAHQVHAVACLAGLPLLRELWLQLENEPLLEQQQQDEPAARPGAAVARLTSLTVLALRGHFSWRCAQPLARGLLQAAAGLMQLQVLDVSGAWGFFTVVEQPWLPLVSDPPPGLREVRLPAPLQGPIPALLRARLPSRVAVAEGASGFDDGELCWGPPPWTVPGMSGERH